MCSEVSTKITVYASLKSDVPILLHHYTIHLHIEFKKKTKNCFLSDKCLNGIKNQANIDKTSVRALSQTRHLCHQGENCVKKKNLKSRTYFVISHFIGSNTFNQ